MNKLEWKEHGYPFSVGIDGANPNNYGRTCRFLTNAAIAMGCDIGVNQPDRWQWLLTYSRVIANIADGDADAKVDPTSVWQNY